MFCRGGFVETFVTLVGFLLGAIIIFCTAFVCSARIKIILRLLINSFVGCACLSIINFLFASHGFHVGISPVTAVCVGVLGVPGAVLVIILSLIL